MKVWKGGGFRVWIRKHGGEQEYQPYLICHKMTKSGPVLCGPMPEVAWLIDGMPDFHTIELHYDMCGNPSVYDSNRIVFSCKYCEAVNWWIEPMGSLSPQDADLAMLYVEYRPLEVIQSYQDEGSR